MAQTGYTPILIYSSSTGGNAPAAGNLTNSTLGSELAINIADGKLFYKDSGGSVQVIGWKTVPTSAGGTGLTSYTAGDVLYYTSGTALSKLAIGSSGAYMSSSGSAPQWTAPAALTKTDDTNVTLTLGGSASTALLNAASLTLGWTGQLATSRGGTGLSSFTSGGVVYASSSSALTTGTALNINATGNIGVSQTQANWSSGGNITLGGNKAITTATENANFGANWYYNGGYTYIANGAATNYYQAAGAHIFQRAATGTAGSTFSFVESGRFDSSGNWSVANGNLVIGTSGKGIDFSATSGTGTSELLDDYEEGYFNPTLTCGTSGTITVNATEDTLAYTKIGRVVYISGQFAISAVSSPVGTVTLNNLPFAVASLDERAESAIFNVILGNTTTNTPVFFGLINASGGTTLLIRAKDNTGAINTTPANLFAANDVWISGYYLTA